MMPCDVIQRNKWVQGLEIMAWWLHDMYIWLGFRPKSAKLVFRRTYIIRKTILVQTYGDYPPGDS